MPSTLGLPSGGAACFLSQILEENAAVKPGNVPQVRHVREVPLGNGYALRDDLAGPQGADSIKRGGQMIHCGDPISYANINTNYWTQHFYSFGRMPAQ